MKFWKLDLKIGILEKYLKIEVLKIKIWRIVWELNLKKINLKIRILGNYFKMEVLKNFKLKIEILENYLKIKFKSGNFGKLNFDIKKNGELKWKCGLHPHESELKSI